MRYRATLVLFALLAGILLIASVNAASPNFTQTFPSYEIVHVNTTYQIASANATSSYEFFMELIMGFVLFFASLYTSTKPEMHQIDGILSAMSTLPMFVAAFTATSVDFVTSYGVTGLVTNTSTVTEWALIENHTVYHFDITGFVLWVFSVISTLNLIRIVVNHRKYDQIMKDSSE
jgi:hypothetical protein